ncbi:MAG: carbohydrate kinase family protein [Rhodanobacteraceae bacterium]
MNTVACFGEALIDFHGSIADTGQPAAFMPHAGGAPANVAVAIAKLGGNSMFVGMLGADMFGDMLLRQLNAAGVDTRHVRRTAEANTALAFVSHDAHGERSFGFYRPPAADLLFRETDFDPGLFGAAAIFHAGSCSLTEPAIAETTLAGMRHASTAGALVSFDMNLRPALWPRDTDPTPWLWQALSLAVLVKLSAEELAFLATQPGGEDAMRDRLWQGATRWLVVTDGTRPIRWFTPNGAGNVPTFAVHAIDSTGAGDAFVGGLLFGLTDTGAEKPTLSAFVSNDARRDNLLRFAATCGALAVTRTGSFAAMPTLAAVHDFTETRA